MVLDRAQYRSDTIPADLLKSKDDLINARNRYWRHVEFHGCRSLQGRSATNRRSMEEALREQLKEAELAYRQEHNSGTKSEYLRMLKALKEYVLDGKKPA